MFKQLTIARIGGDIEGALAGLSDADLAARAFVPCGPAQPRSVGLVPPRGEEGAPLLEWHNGRALLRVREQTKTVPPAAVTRALEERLDLVERETGRRPRGKAKRELKAEVLMDLLPKAFAKDRDTTLWINTETGLLVIGAASTKVVDTVVALLVELAGGAAVHLINTTLSPSSAMSAWLVDALAPPGFSIDRECELKQPDSEKAVVRYARHALELPEIVEHIRQGKLPTKLAMTHADRVSFVLTEGLVLKKIQLLDVATLTESKEAVADAFDGDVAIWTGELELAIDSLIEALGGELKPLAE